MDHQVFDLVARMAASRVNYRIVDLAAVGVLANPKVLFLLV
jgi:hypothetical protein